MHRQPCDSAGIDLCRDSSALFMRGKKSQAWKQALPHWWGSTLVPISTGEWLYPALWLHTAFSTNISAGSPTSFRCHF